MALAAHPTSMALPPMARALPVAAQPMVLVRPMGRVRHMVLAQPIALSGTQWWKKKKKMMMMMMMLLLLLLFPLVHLPYIDGSSLAGLSGNCFIKLPISGSWLHWRWWWHGRRRHGWWHWCYACSWWCRITWRIGVTWQVSVCKASLLGFAWGVANKGVLACFCAPKEGLLRSTRESTDVRGIGFTRPDHFTSETLKAM